MIQRGKVKDKETNEIERRKERRYREMREEGDGET